MVSLSADIDDILRFKGIEADQKRLRATKIRLIEI